MKLLAALLLVFWLAPAIATAYDPSLLPVAHKLSQIAKDSDVVEFNTKTLKYHIPSCMWAKRCTVHCIQITRSEARERGGVPCKVCGGGEN